MPVEWILFSSRVPSGAFLASYNVQFSHGLERLRQDHTLKLPQHDTFAFSPTLSGGGVG